jgi:hypothetical protein
MNGHRQARDPDRRLPIREATPTQQSASGPGDRIASARDVAAYFREDCRLLRDSLQLEMVAAQYHLQMRSVRSPEGVPVGDATSAGVIAELERLGDPLSHAILRALDCVGTGDTATRSAAAVGRLSERGIGLPLAFGDVAGARALSAWRTDAGGRGGEYVLFVDFEHSSGVRHALALFVEPRRGGVLKHIGLIGPMSDVDPDDPFHPSALDPVELAAAGALLREVLDRSFGPLLAGVDDFCVLIAGARARSMVQGGGIA